MTDPIEFEKFFRKKDPPSYFALRALDSLKGSRVQPHRDDICRFLLHRYREIPLASYVRRVRHLRDLQMAFECRGTYEASSYADVHPIDGDEYRIALLLSFILTNHRFEILESLEEFLRIPPDDDSQELLSIGFGTGYELKLVSAILPTWRYNAYDTDARSLSYARDLLGFFGCSVCGLHSERFPLECDELPRRHQRRYTKIVLCELLEHLEHPETALRHLYSALQPRGMMFATMAVNIAQEDHLYLYRTKEEARAQVERVGFTVCRDFVTPVTVMPFAERDRDRMFTKGNYICYLRRS